MKISFTFAQIIQQNSMKDNLWDLTGEILLKREGLWQEH